MNEYPAVPVAPATSEDNEGGWLDFINGIGAVLNTKWIGSYHKSVARGEELLTAKINDTIAACPATQLVLAGFSQGGQVAGNVYQKLTTGQRARVLGVVLFGDPLFNGSDEAVNRGNYDPERNGLLRNTPRAEFQHDPQKVLSYCHAFDPICQGLFSWPLRGPLSKVFSLEQHGNYHEVGDGAGQPTYPRTAAQYLANRLRPAPPSAGPVAELTPLDDQAPGVLFKVSGCASESEGRPLTFDWDLDNSGAFATRSPACVLRTSFARTGDQPIALRVTNDAGQRSIARTVVHVVDPGPYTGMPQAPTDVVSTPGLNNTSALLTWQPPTAGPPVEAYRVFAADGTVLVTVQGGGPGSFRVPAADLPLAVVVQSVNRAGDGGGTSPPVTMSIAGALPDGDLNALWNAYGDQGGHWTGGDSTVSVELPGGRVAWLFSDTFLGAVNADGSRPRSTPFIRNSVVVQQANVLTTLHGGTEENPRTLVELPDEEQGFLWVGDGTVENNELKVLYNRYVSVGNDPLDVAPTGAYLATFALPDVTLTGITELGRGGQIAWMSFYEESDFTYIYGTKTTDDVKFLYAARAPAGNIGGAWQYWTGQSWSGDEAAAAKVLSGIDGMSVTKAGNRYVLFAQDGDGFFSSNIVAYFGPTPTGPFTDKTYLYAAPEPGRYPAGIVYGVQLHPEFGAPGRYVLSYNVNSLDDDANYADARIYRPRFIRVALPGPANPVAPPRPPTNLRATSDDRGVHLTWTASQTPGVSYHVYQRDVTGGQTQAARTGSPVTGTSYNPRFLKNDRTYEFFVTAFNTAGESPPTNTVSAVPRVRPPIAAPTGLTARTNTDGTITLTWNPVADALWYRISFKDDGTTADFSVLNRNISATSFTMTTLASGHTYTFKVAGYTEGGPGPNSAPATATSGIPLPPAPANLTATANNDDCTVRLAWSAPPNQWYWIYQKDVTAGETAFTRLQYPVITGTSFTAGLLTNGHVYQFQVSAINNGGEGPLSTVVTATARCAPPDAPTNLRATAGNNQVTLTWTAPSPSNVWYWVYQRNVTTGEAEFTRLEFPLTRGDTRFTAGFLNNGQTYEFYLTAINQVGEGPRSNIVSATPRQPPPAAPTGLSAIAGGDLSVTLTWTAPEPNAWYWVYRRDVTAGEATFTRSPYPVTEGTRNKAGLLTHGHVYEWRVSAINSGGEGPQSAAVRATARIDPPRDLKATATGDGRAMLSWAGPGEDFWYYLYLRDVTAGHNFARAQFPLTNGTGHVVDLLVNGHVYEFYLTTIAPGGSESGPSNIARMTARGGVPAPPSLSATAGDARVNLSWSATGELYWIYRRCVDCGETNFIKFSLPTDDVRFTDTGVANGFTYEYRVSAVNVHGEGGWSNGVRVRPLPPLPAAPGNLTAQPGDAHVQLRWNAPGPGLWYWVYWRDVTAGQSGFTRSTYPITSGPAFNVIWLTNAHTYDFFVTAVNVAGEGPRSGIVRARPMPPLPTPPRDVTFSYDSPDSGVLTWAPATPPQVYYYVYQRDASNGESFRRLHLPTAGTQFSIIMLKAGHRYEFYVTAINAAGESGRSNIVHVNPGPRDQTLGCGTASGSFRHVPGGVLQFSYPVARVCGSRDGDRMHIGMSWNTSGHELLEGIFWFSLIDCTTGGTVWSHHMSYPNGASGTSASKATTLYIYSGSYYRVRVTGGGHVADGNHLFNDFDLTVPRGIRPFEGKSGCF